ncbi:MAG: Gfo/Idh/MocA family oxidoreductase [Verrucomicrobia bacterium]|nr:Gfo/Idh/MocA family oxidoreductase [Verrucomicrobiota bacterium]
MSLPHVSPSAVSRRRFLKISGAGAVAFPLILRSGAWGATAANRKLNVAMIGCGNRAGNALLPSLAEEGENIVAICDVNPAQIARVKAGGARPTENARKVSARTQAVSKAVAGAKVYDDFRRLLEQEKSLDAVIIAPGQRWHMPMAKAALLAGKHVFCEKPLAHSVAEARDIAKFMPGTKLITQIGTQGGATDTFRRSMEIIQAGLIGQVREVHCWMNRTFPPSEGIAPNSDPIPTGLNWDAWCGPAPVHPFKEYYLGGCLQWGRWLDYGDGHLADMGAHAHNLPLRALELGAPIRITVKSSEPAKASYPAVNSFRWDFAARGKFDAVSVWWHDGPDAAPPADLTADVRATYGKVPTNGCLFYGDKGILNSDAWGQGGVMRLKSDANPKCRGVLDHEAAKAVAFTYPRAPKQNHMKEFLDACKGGPKTFQSFDIAARAAEFGMTGIVALRVGQTIEWDSANLKAKGCPQADRWIHLPQRKTWLA